MRKRLQRKGLMAILATSTLAGAVLLDTALAERYAALAPLQSLSRLIPWATTFCMTSITLAAAFWLLGVYLLSNHAPKTSAALITATLALLGFWQWRDYDEQLRDYRALSNPSLRSVAVSPSAATLIHHIHATATDPAQTLANIATLDDATWQKVSRVTASVETSLDGAPADQGAEPSTRKLFPIKFTRSLGSEFISVSFSTPITTQGLRIKLGKHTSDFAPGLLIQNGPCSAPLQTLINAPDWQGAISLTPSGYPYFLGQDDIRIIFANPISTSALCLRNTRSSNFDWYVGRIDLMSTSPSPDTSDVEPG
jgi:hypothetical protein